VLRLSGRTATYLPQVWETIPDKQAFLGSLCRKAGLDSNAWRDPDIEVQTYRAFEISEPNGA